MNGKMPHLDFFGCLASSMERNWVRKKRSKARFTCTSEDPNVMLRKEPVSVAVSTCWLNLTSKYSGELIDTRIY